MDTPASTRPATLAAALAAFQAHLPSVRKSETAEVKTKTGGTYRYSYADLAKVSAVALPLLGGLGLSFTAKPTMNATGRFVLAYRLLHESGEEDSGEYPLPQEGSAQELGSAITYARRYCLCSVTGLAPDDDDDGAAASNTRTHVDRDGFERPPQPEPAPAQLAREQDLTMLLRRASSEAGLLTGWEMVKSAYKADEITTVQANALKAEIARLKALLTTESAPTEEPAADILLPEQIEPDDPPPPPPMKDATRRKLFALYRDCGYDGDDNRQQRRDVAGKILDPHGRPVASVGELSDADALVVVAALAKRKRDLAAAAKAGGV